VIVAAIKREYFEGKECIDWVLMIKIEMRTRGIFGILVSWSDQHNKHYDKKLREIFCLGGNIRQTETHSK